MKTITLAGLIFVGVPLAAFILAMLFMGYPKAALSALLLAAWAAISWLIAFVLVETKP